ncbi:MAG: metallophosphoesterase family protein [Planctomycetes bacterium]|nr:metallophosphoesterase family protein [Planctomycetota bacterium]
MRILLLADIHANWPALSAIDEDFDVCIFLGDLVDYATDPSPCVEWVRRHSTLGVRGNHDHAFAQRVPVKKLFGLSVLASATRSIHLHQLDRAQTKFLSRLPVTRRCQIDGRRFCLVHATPRDPLDEYLGPDQAAWATRLQGIDVDFVCVGHSHQQFVLQVGRTTVVNPGSVGQPRDGDPRCAYAVIENGRVELRRKEYDIDATIRQMRHSGLEPQLVELAEHILRTGGQVDTQKWERFNGVRPAQ